MYKPEKVATIAERLNEAIKLKGKKQIDLVQGTGVNKSTISRYLRGEREPKQTALLKLARVLDVSEAWLMGFDVSMERNKTLTSERQMLSEGEKMLLELFNQVPKDQQRMVIEMIRVALKKKE